MSNLDHERRSLRLGYELKFIISKSSSVKRNPRCALCHGVTNPSFAEYWQRGDNYKTSRKVSVVTQQSKKGKRYSNEYPVLKLNTTNLYGLKEFWDRFSIRLRVDCSAGWWVLFRSKVRNSRCWGNDVAHDNKLKLTSMRTVHVQSFYNLPR